MYLKPKKFIAKSDDFDINGYLTEEIDENICLYSSDLISNSTSVSNSQIKDNLLGEANLESPSCKSFCSNTLRFTDLKDSTKLYDGGIEDQVWCKL